MTEPVARARIKRAARAERNVGGKSRVFCVYGRARRYLFAAGTTRREDAAARRARKREAEFDTAHDCHLLMNEFRSRPIRGRRQHDSHVMRREFARGSREIQVL